ncbi:MAG: hydroxymethylbilane synthase [Actinomycetota bacterium]
MTPTGHPLRVATRGSRQATAQSNAVAAAIEGATGRPVELVVVETTGDRRADVPLHQIGGQGVFVKEVQRAVLDGRADVAVHSAKDLTSTQEPGLVIGAICTRRTPNDALVGASLAELADGATVATGSVRRRAQLAAARPDLQFVELRGNIDTRLNKLPDGGALVMAVAALEIVGRTERIADVLPIERFVPAVGQGSVAVECRADDLATRDALEAIDDPTTHHAVAVERSFLAELGAGCTMPVGAHVADDVLHTFLADESLATAHRATLPLDGGQRDHDIAVHAARAAHAAVTTRDG